jgi:ERCC4-type nuclease
MISASIDELMKVEGIGKESTKKIRDVLDAEWDTSNLESAIKRSLPAKSFRKEPETD